MDEYKEVNGIMIKFEDLISNNIDLGEIAKHIGVAELDVSVLERKIGTPAHAEEKVKKRLSPYDRFVINIIGGSLLKRLGYKQ